MVERLVCNQGVRGSLPLTSTPGPFITEKSGRRRRAIEVNCLQCSKPFLKRLNWSRKYPQKFCSTECSFESKRDRVEVVCWQCGSKFEKRVSRTLSKSGLLFCSRACKDYAQSIDGGCKEIQNNGVREYGTGVHNYRHQLDKNPNPKCVDPNCNESRRYLLVAHHIDGDRNNAARDNLETVCFSCHGKRHLKLVDDRWVYCSSSLTPRHMLDKL